MMSAAQLLTSKAILETLKQHLNKFNTKSFYAFCGKSFKIAMYFSVLSSNYLASA
jgi:hypothetical protein